MTFFYLRFMNLTVYRSAGHHALEILYDCKAKRVIMHAFDGR